MGDKTPEYNKRATKNYISKFDMVNLRLPKGTKGRINKHSDSLNKFISNLVLAELERLEQVQNPGPATNPLDEFNF